MWWGASVGCGAILYLKRPSRGGGCGTRELLRKFSESKSRGRAGGARASQLWWLTSWDKGSKRRGRGMARVKAAMRGSGRSAPMMGCVGEYSCVWVVWWGSGVGVM